MIFDFCSFCNTPAKCRDREMCDLGEVSAEEEAEIYNRVSAQTFADESLPRDNPTVDKPSTTEEDMAANKRYTKYARYHSKPFETGNGLTHEPGWYTWRIGKFAETLQRYDAPEMMASPVTAAELQANGFTVIMPHDELPPTRKGA